MTQPHYVYVDHTTGDPQWLCASCAPAGADLEDAASMPVDDSPYCSSCDRLIYTPLNKEGIRSVVADLCYDHGELSEPLQQALKFYKDQIFEEMGGKTLLEVFGSRKTWRNHNGREFIVSYQQELHDKINAGHIVNVCDNASDIVNGKYSYHAHQGWYADSLCDEIYKGEVYFCGQGYFGLISSNMSDVVWILMPCDDPREAAASADTVAEYMAEEEYCRREVESEAYVCRSNLQTANDSRRQAITIFREYLAASTALRHLEGVLENSGLSIVDVYDLTGPIHQRLEASRDESIRLDDCARNEREDVWRKINESLSLLNDEGVESWRIGWQNAG